MRLAKNSGGKSNDLGGAMTDISFLLIIFFLVTAVFVAEEGFSSNLPDEDSVPKQEEKNNVLQVNVASNGVVHVDETSYTDLDILSIFIESLMQQNSQMIAIINIEEGVSYGQAVKVIASIKAGGISEFTVSSGVAEDKRFLIPLSIQDEKIIEGGKSQ